MGQMTKVCSVCGHEAGAKSRLEFYSDKSSPDGLAARCIECTKEARAEARARRRQGLPPAPLPEAERRRRSDLAKQLHRDGKLKAKEDGAKGGRPRVTSVTEDLLERVKDESDLFWNALRAALKADSENTRMRAVEFVATLEKQAQDRKDRGAQPTNMGREELVGHIVTGLLELRARGQINENDIFEGTAVEMPQPELEAGKAA